LRERKEGIERLRGVAKNLKHELSAAQAITIDIPVVALGLTTLQDTEIFNECVPHLKILQPDVDRGDHQFVLRASTKRVLQQNGGDALDDGAAALKAFDSALQFLGALAISTGALVLWRRARFEPNELRGQRVEQGLPLEVRFGETPVNVAPLECHAGHLWGAIQLLMMFINDQWTDRFLLTYQKAQMFLATPALAAVDLYEDAFLGFFRCLEYVTMTQALGGRRGQFDEMRLAEALAVLNIQADNGPDAVKRVGKRLVRRRAEASAHLAHAASKARLEPREVWELKGMLDLMIINFRKLKISRERIAKTTSAGASNQATAPSPTEASAPPPAEPER